MHKRFICAPARRFAACLLLGLAVSLGGCASSGLHVTDSANQNSRVSIVVIHHTTANFEDSLRILTEPSSRPVSSQ